MRILFDQGTPVQIRRSLEAHTVKTSKEQGWSTLANGELLRVAEEAGLTCCSQPTKTSLFSKTSKVAGNCGRRPWQRPVAVREADAAAGCYRGRNRDSRNPRHGRYTKPIETHRLLSPLPEITPPCMAVIAILTSGSESDSEASAHRLPG